MKRLIPIVILLAGAVAAGVYFYPRFVKKIAPSNDLTLSGNIEAHESLMSFKVQGRIVDFQYRRGSRWRQVSYSPALKMPTSGRESGSTRPGVDVRQSNLALTLAGTREQEVKASQQAMMDAQADLEQKKLDDTARSSFFPKMRLQLRIAIWPQPPSSALRRHTKRRSNGTTRPRRAAAKKISRSLALTSRRQAPISACRESTRVTHAACAFNRCHYSARGRAWRSSCTRLSCRSRLPISITSGCAPISPRQIWAASPGARKRQSQPIPIRASNITGASRSSRPTPSSRQRACRRQPSVSRLSIASRSTSIIPITN